MDSGYEETYSAQGTLPPSGSRVSQDIPRFLEDTSPCSEDGDKEHWFPFNKRACRPIRRMFNIHRRSTSLVKNVQGLPSMYSFHSLHFSKSHGRNPHMRGGFGSIEFRRLHDHVGTKVAIKFPLKSSSADQCFENEVYITGVLCPSPNIVCTLGYYFNGLGGSRATAIVMQKYDGSLFDFIHTGGGCKGSITYARHLLHLLAGTADGVAHMHACGFIHNDLSCQNVFVDASCDDVSESRLPDAVVGDFGRATHASEHLPIVFAAEWLARRSDLETHLSPASDVLSLGTIVLSALCGVSKLAPSVHDLKQCVECVTSSHLLESLQYETKALQQHVVDELMHVVKRCTELLPSLRSTASQASDMLWKLFADIL